MTDLINDFMEALLSLDKLSAEQIMDFDAKIVVGGAPFRFDDQLWWEVGADTMCRTASEVVNVIHEVAGGVS